MNFLRYLNESSAISEREPDSGLEKLAGDGIGERIPNWNIITGLLKKVKSNPGEWQSAVRSCADLPGWQSQYKHGVELLSSEMSRGSRQQYTQWLNKKLDIVKSTLSKVAMRDGVNAMDVLKHACEALIVYDAVTPPKLAKQSLDLLQSSLDDLQSNLQSSLTSKTPQVAVALMIVVKIFMILLKDQNGHEETPDQDSMPKISEPEPTSSKTQADKIFEQYQRLVRKLT